MNRYSLFGASFENQIDNNVFDLCILEELNKEGEKDTNNEDEN